MTSQDTHLKTGRSLRRTTSCSKSLQFSASCDLKLPFPTHDSHQRSSETDSLRENFTSFIRFLHWISNTRAWSQSGERQREEPRTELTFLLFPLIRSVDRSRGSAVVFASRSDCSSSSGRLFCDSQIFFRNQQSPTVTGAK